MQVKVKIPKEFSAEMRKLLKQAVKIADKKENEFLFPYLRNFTNGRKITIKRLLDRNIKRVVNPNTLEVWYEQDGKVITPSFIRDLSKMIDDEN